MTLTTEERVYQFIKTAVDAATATNDAGLPLFGLEVHDHFFRKIETNAGIRIGTASGQISPFPGGEEFGEYNVNLTLVVYVRIVGTQKDGDERTEAMRQVCDISKALAALFWDNPSCDERFRDTRLRDFIRGYDSLKAADPYAVGNLTLIINEMGGTIGG